MKNKLKFAGVVILVLCYLVLIDYLSALWYTNVSMPYRWMCYGACTTATAVIATLVIYYKNRTFNKGGGESNGL